jgi:hypothetical protein
MLCPTHMLGNAFTIIPQILFAFEFAVTFVGA